MNEIVLEEVKVSRNVQKKKIMNKINKIKNNLKEKVFPPVIIIIYLINLN